MRLALLSACWLVAGIGFATAQAQEVGEAERLIRHAMTTQSQVRFAGTRVVEVRIAGERRRHVEHVLRDGPRQRIEFEASSPMSGQIVVEDGERRMHFLPGRNEIRVSPPRRDAAMARLRQLLVAARSGRVRVDVTDGPVTAGLATKRITFSDPQGNPLTLLDLNPRSGIVVRREVRDATGARVGFYEFTSLRLQPNAGPEDFRIVRRGAKLVYPQQELQRASRQLGVPALVLPDTEQFALEAIRVVEIGDTSVIEATYTGELGRLSMYIFKGSIDYTRLRRLAAESMSLARGARGEATFVLMAEIPAAALSEMTQNVQSLPGG